MSALQDLSVRGDVTTSIKHMQPHFYVMENVVATEPVCILNAKCDCICVTGSMPRNQMKMPAQDWQYAICIAPV